MTKPAANPVSVPETIAVDAHADQVMCDGGGGALGHPVVWYNFSGKQSVDCLYCDRRFVKDLK
jgi:uncharacterized Zn-finger protein